MSNISDNLRDFPERPQDVQCWPKKTEFYFTLSVILKKQDKIKKKLDKIVRFQNEIINQLTDNIEISENPYKTNGLYKYSQDNLHFSLINFLKYNIGGNFSEFKEKFAEFRKAKQNNSGYQNTVKKIKESLSNVFTVQGKHIIPQKEIEAHLRWIETGDECRALDSFALQAYLDPVFIEFLQKTRKKIEKNRSGIFEVSEENIDITLKAYPNKNPRRFALNILRFISANSSYAIDEEKKIKTMNIIEKINRKHNDKPLLKFKIKKLSLVESDPFLFNDNPGISGYDA